MKKKRKSSFVPKYKQKKLPVFKPCHPLQKNQKYPHQHQRLQHYVHTELSIDNYTQYHIPLRDLYRDTQRFIRNTNRFYCWKITEWIAIALITQEQIQDLNFNYLSHNYPTDVLTFPDEAWNSENASGDIAVCPDVIYDHYRNDLKRKKHLENPLLSPAYLILETIIHGILHLYSVHHAKSPKSISYVRKLQRELIIVLEPAFLKVELTMKPTLPPREKIVYDHTYRHLFSMFN